MSADANLAREDASLSTTERREYLVGSLMALVLVLILIFTAMANRGGKPEAAGALTLTAAFNRADGVSVGTPVRVAGVNIGVVSAAALDDQRRAVLTFDLTHPINLPDDTAAVIETDGIFGSKYIELRAGGTENMLKPGGRMSYTQDSVIIEDLVALIVQRAKAARADTAAKNSSPTSAPTADDSKPDESKPDKSKQGEIKQ